MLRFARIDRKSAVSVCLMMIYCLAATNVFAQGVGNTSIGGYGNAVYARDIQSKFSTIDLERFVLFVGHEFSKKVSLVSELEMEDAKVSGGEAGGEIAFEQAYIQFRLDGGHYFVAGLFLPRIGILNEDHLPTSFNGNERTDVETLIIPSTWRELGVGFYGSNDIVPVDYSIAIVNGLNASGFEHGSLIREGRFEGRNASANNIALTGSVQYAVNSLRFQVSGYYGGSVGLRPSDADSLHLQGGPFGTPVAVGEADIRYSAGPLALRVLGTLVSIPDAEAINNAYGNNTPLSAYGAYAETAYDFLYVNGAARNESLTAFVRYERLNLNASLPSNGIPDGALNVHHVIAGLGYSPLENIVFKGDVRFTWRASRSESPDGTGNTTLTLGLGFSF